MRQTSRHQFASLCVNNRKIASIKSFLLLFCFSINYFLRAMDPCISGTDPNDPQSNQLSELPFHSNSDGNSAYCLLPDIIYGFYFV